MQKTPPWSDFEWVNDFIDGSDSCSRRWRDSYNDWSPIARGTILIDNGKVSAVGTDIDIPENAHVIQLAQLSHSLIDTWTAWLSGNFRCGCSDTRSGLGDVTAFHRVIDSYDDSSLIPIQRIHGGNCLSRSFGWPGVWCRDRST